MRYIGGKSLLTDKILSVIKDNCPNAKSVIDVFSGSGVVADALKSSGYKVVANDMLYFSYVLNRGSVAINKKPEFACLGIENPIEYLNDLTFEAAGIDIEKCFIYQNYSPNKSCDRMYFQNKNALKIDIIRITIEKWHSDNKINDDEYYYLLSSLIAAVPYVANITGVYSAYLKHWDVRTYNDLLLTEPQITSSRTQSLVYNSDYCDILSKLSADVLYADPPYNERQYLPNYHILETIAKYDYPTISGKTGMRDYSAEKSEFCQKSKVKDAFTKLITQARTKYIVISYTNEGLISSDELANICKEYSVENTFKLFEFDYRRYKSKIPNTDSGLKEQLYVFEKKETRFNKSPMNYIGGKYKLLPQIVSFFPEKINTFVDLFVGGGDVFSNIQANRIIANDNNNYLIEIYNYFKSRTVDEILQYIDTAVESYDLSETNESGYNEFRKRYNQKPSPIDLFILSCYSFNHQIRFNSKHEFNCPFGKNRSYFNESIRHNLIEFQKAVQKADLVSNDFRRLDLSMLQKDDFVYADPPYLITTGSYNDGKRGFDGWTQSHDEALFSLLDNLNAHGIKFALSNVIEHKGRKNDRLIRWASKYHIHHLNFDYCNSNYHSKNTEEKTTEILVVNY